MPLDAVFLTALHGELAPVLQCMKIDRVQQPERDLLIFSLRGNGQNVRLLVSTATGSARVNITNETYENPASPPMFCMLLRKHLVGARIEKLTQQEMERLLVFELRAYDEMGAESPKSLVVELMGRNSNIILVDAEGRVIDCLRRVSGDFSQGRRQVLPGLFYKMPPGQDKPCFFTAGSDARQRLWAEADGSDCADKWLTDSFSAVSPLVARELCYRTFGDVSPRIATMPLEQRELFPDAMDALAESVTEREFTPYMILEGGIPKDFSFMNIRQYGLAAEGRELSGFSELLDAFYAGRDRAQQSKRRAAELTKTVKTARDRVLRRLSAQEQELKATRGREERRKCGDLITANMYRLEKGMEEFYAEDYFEPDCPKIVIRLDPLKTPQQNAAVYYKAYNKLKAAEIHLSGQLAQGEAQLEYLNSVLDETERCETGGDLAEIRRELEETGYLRKQNSKGKRRQQDSRPLRFVSDSGVEILVGKNNTQNDMLTTKTAQKSDVWLHTQKIHGSHVIIRCAGAEPDEITLKQAASLAAYYSKGREAGRVPVDYTQVRYVKKPNGAMPGMVVYTDYKTLAASADGELVSKLRA